MLVLILTLIHNVGEGNLKPLCPPGHSSLFPMEDERPFGEDESGDQGLAGLGSAHCFPHLNGERVERYSRKVFVGGLPPDIDEGEDASLAPPSLCRCKAAQPTSI